MKITKWFNDKIGYVTNDVSELEVVHSNTCEENRVKFVTDLAAISRGKHESNNPEKRYKSLLKEAAGNDITLVCPGCGSTRVDGEWGENISVEGWCSCLDCGFGVHDFEKYPTAFKTSKHPSRPLEFLPIVLGYTTKGDIIRITQINGEKLPGMEHHLEVYLTEFSNGLGRYSYLKDSLIYTNMRAVINFGIPYESIPYASETEALLYYSKFVALRAKLPMFVWAQVPNTHTAISKEAQSDRVVTVNEYWLPDELRKKTFMVKEAIVNGDMEVDEWVAHTIENILSANPKDKIADVLVNGNRESGYVLSQGDVQEYLKLLGYPKEIYNRAMYYFKYKEVVMTGWYSDPNVWCHLMLERNYYSDVAKNWTQSTTADVVKMIGDIIIRTIV